MRECGGTHIKDLCCDRGVHGEFINGLTQLKLIDLNLDYKTNVAFFESLGLAGG